VIYQTFRVYQSQVAPDTSLEIIRCVASVYLAVLGPLVLPPDLLLLLRGEIVCDVECLPDLLGRLALDHIGNSLAANVEQRLNVEIVCCLCTCQLPSQGWLGTRTHENDLKKHLLVDLHEFLVPLVDVCCLLPAITLFLCRLDGVTTVLLAPLYDLAQHRIVDVRDWNRRVAKVTQVIHQILDQHRPLGDNTI